MIKKVIERTLIVTALAVVWLVWLGWFSARPPMMTDPETLAGVLRTLRADSDQRRRLGMAGRAHVRQTRQPSTHARALGAFLREVAHG